MKRRLTILNSIVVMALVGGCDNPKAYQAGRCHASQGESVVLSDKPSDSLRVVTANMWGIPYWSRDVDARFAAMAARLNGDPTIDVVGMEEMWDSSARVRFLSLVADQYPYRADFHSEYGRSGLVIISRKPFLGRPLFVPYDQVGKWWKPWTGEWMGGKGIGAVRIQAGDQQPWIFVTHLHACYSGPDQRCEDSDEYADIRVSQVENLRATVNRIAASEPAIVLGDFNFTTHSRYIELLARDGRNGMFDPSWSLVSEPNAPRGRIDHVWLRPGQISHWRGVEPAVPHFMEPVTLADGRSVGLSDHCPIVAAVAPMAKAKTMKLSQTAVEAAAPTAPGS